MSKDREQKPQGAKPREEKPASVTGGAAPATDDAAPATSSAPTREEVANFAASVPPRRPDGSEWPEIAGMKPGDPYYGVMLEQMEWEERKKKRYSLVLAVQIAFIVAVIGIIVYFVVTS